jgi:hypothetical protein
MPGLEQSYLIAGAQPDYSAVLANHSARSSPAHITVVSGALCGNRRSLGHNPYFKGVDLGTVAAHRGCSFCSSARMPSLTPPGEDLKTIIERQFRGILETAGTAGRNKGIFEFYDFQAFRRFNEVFDLVLRLRVPPAVFLFNPRLDDVLRVRHRIRKTLPALAQAGHEVRFLSMGIENFSERENRRLNKGISLVQVDEFLALTKKWATAYPGVFRPFKAGHDKVELGFILFTPWTTLTDIRLNLTRARARNFSRQGYWLYSTLHIREGEPICFLARKKGDVLVERWPDQGQAYGLFMNEGEAGALIPWRFKDARVADFFALLVRVCAAQREGEACAFFQGDPEFAQVCQAYIQARARAEVSPLGFALALLGLMGNLPPNEARAVLLRKALERAALLSGSAQGPGAPEPSIEARAIARVFRRLKNTPCQAAFKIAPQSVEDVTGLGPRRLRLTFSDGGNKIVVDLLEGKTPGPCFLRSRLFRAVYHPAAPITSSEQSRSLARMLESIDIGVAQARKAAARRAAEHRGRGA